MSRKREAARVASTSGDGSDAAGSALSCSEHTTTPIFVQGNVVGTVTKGVFYKVVCGSKHKLKVPPGWALDISSLASAEQAGAHTVQIYDRETGKTCIASIEDIRAFGRKFNRGHGDQIMLVDGRWSVDGAMPTAQAEAQVPAAPTEGPVQPLLFDLGRVRR